MTQRQLFFTVSRFIPTDSCVWLIRNFSSVDTHAHALCMQMRRCSFLWLDLFSRTSARARRGLFFCTLGWLPAGLPRLAISICICSPLHTPLLPHILRQKLETSTVVVFCSDETKTCASVLQTVHLANQHNYAQLRVRDESFLMTYSAWFTQRAFETRCASVSLFCRRSSTSREMRLLCK